MKSILTKLFPRHDAGTAGFMVAMLLTAILTAGITISDYFGEGADWFEVGFVVLCLALAGGTYLVGRKDQRVGK